MQVTEPSRPTDPQGNNTSSIAEGKTKIVTGRELPFRPKVVAGTKKKPVGIGTVSQQKENEVVSFVEKVKHSGRSKPRQRNLDEPFFVSLEKYKRFEKELESQVSMAKDFSTQIFLSGQKALPDAKKMSEEENRDYSMVLSVMMQQKNQEILQKGIGFAKKVAQKITDEEKKALLARKGQGAVLSPKEEKDCCITAYKRVIGLFDVFDEKNPQKSTFPLRCSVLLAAREDGVDLESWMAFTKGKKPTAKDIWDFVGKWSNWVPEAQGAFAKFSETIIAKAISVAEKNLSNVAQSGKSILLKGGFGAGKSRLAHQLSKTGDLSAVVAPDSGKHVVRRALPTLSHSQAQVQGSQVAFALFDDLVNKVVGNIAYDSSLRDPGDLEKYLHKARAVNKAVVVYDVARDDIARALSVLCRTVDGEDPRIPPDYMINATIKDKMQRAACMAVILGDKADVKRGAPMPEYHFQASNAKGVDSKELVILRPNGQVEIVDKDALHRLEEEGVKLTLDTATGKWSVKCVAKESELKQNLVEDFQQPVRKLIERLDEGLRKGLMQVFAERQIALSCDPTSPETFYEAFSDNFKTALTLEDVKSAFRALPEETAQRFFFSILGKPSISFLDLPLHVALTLNAKLLQDPWKNAADV